MKKHSFLILATLFLHIGCASNTNPKPATNGPNGEPTKVVRDLFETRPQNPTLYRGGTRWELEKILINTAPTLADKISKLNKTLDKLESEFGNYEMPYSSYERFLQLSNTDPLTTCNQPPLSTKIEKQRSYGKTLTYSIIYKVQGSSYVQETLITTEFSDSNGNWLLSNVIYGHHSPEGAGLPRSLLDNLETQQSLLDDTYARAKADKGNLTPKIQVGTTPKMGRGIFDKKQ